MKKLLELTFTEKPLKSPPVVFSGVVKLKKKKENTPSALLSYIGTPEFLRGQ